MMASHQLEALHITQPNELRIRQVKEPDTIEELHTTQAKELHVTQSKDLHITQIYELHIGKVSRVGGEANL